MQSYRVASYTIHLNTGQMWNMQRLLIKGTTNGHIHHNPVVSLVLLLISLDFARANSDEEDGPSI